MRPPPGSGNGMRAEQPLPPGIRPALALGGAYHSLPYPPMGERALPPAQKDESLEHQSFRIGSLDDINDDNSPVLNG